MTLGPEEQESNNNSLLFIWAKSHFDSWLLFLAPNQALSVCEVRGCESTTKSNIALLPPRPGMRVGVLRLARDDHEPKVDNLFAVSHLRRRKLTTARTCPLASSKSLSLSYFLSTLQQILVMKWKQRGENPIPDKHLSIIGHSERTKFGDTVEHGF